MLDLHAIERLILELGGMAGAEVFAVCGKVGGVGKYGSVFGPLAGRLHLVVEEGRARSVYRFPASARSRSSATATPRISASRWRRWWGKYVREALMARVARRYKRAVPGLRGASGYHDPVTSAFIGATRLVRRAREIPAACFERRAAEGDASLENGSP